MSTVVQSVSLSLSSVCQHSGVEVYAAPLHYRSRASDYLLVALANLLVGVLLLCGVGILEGLPPCWREADRGVGLPESVTASDMSEQTDWMSEMSKSEASLPLRLLPRLPALLPGLLGILLEPIA